MDSVVARTDGALRHDDGTTRAAAAKPRAAAPPRRLCVNTRFDSGQPCAWTAGDDKGYAMVASPYAEFYETRADAQLKYYAEWYDFSTTTRIVCVLDDLLGPSEPLLDANDTIVSKVDGGARMVHGPDATKLDGAAGVVNVTLPAAEQIVDSPTRTVEQDLPAIIERQLIMATRDLYCTVLLGFRIWNVAYQATDDDATPQAGGGRGDCVLWNERYNDDGTFGDHLVFNGSSMAFGEDEAVGGAIPSAKTFEFMDELTPVISHVSPTFGSAGQIVTIHGRGFAPTREVWDTNWYVVAPACPPTVFFVASAARPVSVRCAVHGGQPKNHKKRHKTSNTNECCARTRLARRRRYMDEFGFYTQPQDVTVYVGDNPTVITHKNDTHIEMLVIYNTAEVAWDVQVWVHGKGRAEGNATFTYGLYIYDISPPGGSILGGTPLTITGSGFATTYTFYSEENNNDMGSSLATQDVVFGGDKYSEGNGGVRCAVTKATSTTMECTTKDPATAANDIALDDGALETYVSVAWNFEPFYFYCGMPPSDCTPPGCRIDQDRNFTRACHFAFEQAATPRLVQHATNAADGPLDKLVVAGDALSFELRDACWNSTNGSSTTECLTDVAKLGGKLSDNFNWTAWGKAHAAGGAGYEGATGALLDGRVAIDGAALSVDLPGNISCAPVYLNLSASPYGSLTCDLPARAVPQGEGNHLNATVWLDGVGYAQLYGPNTGFMLRPTVSSVAVRREVAWASGKLAESGSMGGGLELTIRGRGFVAEYLNYVRIAQFDVNDATYYGYCADVVVVNETTITCVTPAVSYESSAIVTVVVNGTMSVCEAPFDEFRWTVDDGFNTTNYTSTNHTRQDACRFTMSADDTPTIESFSPKIGTFDEDLQYGKLMQTVSFAGTGFVPGNTTVTLGSAVCEIVRENATNLECKLPKHAGGTYEVAVSVAGKGLAIGTGLWFTFGVSLDDVSPKRGSLLAGTEMTFRGRGFATCTPVEDDRGVFGGGLLSPPSACVPETVGGAAVVNYFAAYDGAYFDAIVVRSSWDEIVAVSTLIANSDCYASASACDQDDPAVLRVGVGDAGSGTISGGTATASSEV